MQVLAAHCLLKQSLDMVASPGVCSPSLSTDREQQQQHILTHVPAKAAPAQRHAHHCSICWAVRHSHTRARIHAGTHTLTRTCCARDGLRQFSASLATLHTCLTCLLKILLANVSHKQPLQAQEKPPCVTCILKLASMSVFRARLSISPTSALPLSCASTCFLQT